MTCYMHCVDCHEKFTAPLYVSSEATFLDMMATINRAYGIVHNNINTQRVFTTIECNDIYKFVRGVERCKFNPKMRFYINMFTRVIAHCVDNDHSAQLHTV